MLSSLTRNWWVAVLRGTMAILFGIAAFVLPGSTLELLVALFGAYAFLDGISQCVQGVRAMGSRESWFAPLTSGLLGIATGVLTFWQPALTAVSLVYVVAAWAIVTGTLQIVTAIRARDVISDEWLMGLGGAFSIVFGALLLSAPLAGAVTLVLLFGFYAIAGGLSQIALGLKVRRLDQHLPRLRPAPSTT
jgi:uncharacterized membrane protein HdeD (DUF308 family)